MSGSDDRPKFDPPFDQPFDHNGECLYCDEPHSHAADCPWLVELLRLLAQLLRENAQLRDRS